jgi:hypothetical protein
MTDKQPEALRIASEVSASAILLEHLPSNPGFNGAVLLIDDTEAERAATGCAAAAAELRRLHALNAELVEALGRLHASHMDYTESQQRGWPNNPAGYPSLEWSLEIEQQATAALSKAKEQS